MTVSSTIIKTAPYACDGATTQFAFTWLVWTSSEIKVILRLVSDGSETTLTEGTAAGNYSVTLSTDTPSAGYITTVTTYSALYEIVVKAQFPNTQEVDYGEGDKFPASSHEEALDRGVRLVQQLNEQLSRAILWPETSILEDIELPEVSASNANYYLKVNNAGSAIEWGELVALGSLTTHDTGDRLTIHQNLLAELTADTNTASPGLALVAIDAEVATGNHATKTVSPSGLASVLQYDTIQVPAGSLIPAEDNAGTQDTQEYLANNTLRDYVEMGGPTESGDESVAYYITLWLPITWDQATLKFKAAWMATYDTALVAGSAVEIGIQTKAFNAGSPIDTNWSTPPVYISDAVTNVATDTEEETAASANIASAVTGSTNRIDLRVTRRNTGDNKEVSAVWLTQLLFQYKKTNVSPAW